jgi:hypothetical protein
MIAICVENRSRITQALDESKGKGLYIRFGTATLYSHVQGKFP